MTTIDHPQEYKEGIRILMLTTRSKDGGSNNPDRVSTRLISKNAQEFDAHLQKMLSVAKEPQRIYATADPRNIEKAIRIFKQRQLDADYYDIDSRHGFYLDIENRWLSSLQSPQARTGTTFMVDIDDPKNEEESIRREILQNNLVLKHEYPTKNGKHFILEPFNPEFVSFACLKNHMILWAY